MKITNELNKEMRDELDYKLEFSSVCQDILDILRKEEYKYLTEELKREELSCGYKLETSNIELPKSENIFIVVSQEMDFYFTHDKHLYLNLDDMYYIKKLIKEVIKNLNIRSCGNFDTHIENKINLDIRERLSSALNNVFTINAESYSVSLKDGKGMIRTENYTGELDFGDDVLDIYRSIIRSEIFKKEDIVYNGYSSKREATILIKDVDYDYFKMIRIALKSGELVIVETYKTYDPVGTIKTNKYDVLTFKRMIQEGRVQ